MLFNFSKPKSESKSPNETEAKTSFQSEDHKTIRSLKWMSCFVTVLLLIIILSVVIPVYIWNYITDNRIIDADGNCHYKQQKGICLANILCCDGEYIIGRDICSSNGFCCLGNLAKCREPIDNETDLWSFQSLTEMSTQIIGRNVSEPEMEQATVFSVSAIQDYEYFSDISEKIGQEMNSATGHQWYCIVGNKESFDISLKQFEAFVIITISEYEVFLFKVQTDSSDDNQIDYNFGVDTRPVIDVLHNEMNKTMSTFIEQTLNYVLSSCLNNYKCVANKTVFELNQQFGNEWQCIISSKTNELVVDVNYINGTLLDVIYNKKYRIVVYKVVVKPQIIESEVIENARKAISMNTTIIANNYLGYTNTTEALNKIYSAVFKKSGFKPICNYLVLIYGKKYRNNWGCVAGVEEYYSLSIAYSGNNYIELVLSELRIILFERS